MVTVVYSDLLCDVIKGSGDRVRFSKVFEGLQEGDFDLACWVIRSRWEKIVISNFILFLFFYRNSDLLTGLEIVIVSRLMW